MACPERHSTQAVRMFVELPLGCLSNHLSIQRCCQGNRCYMGGGLAHDDHGDPLREKDNCESFPLYSIHVSYYHLSPPPPPPPPPNVFD